MKTPASPASPLQPLPRECNWEQWERGRAARRRLALQFNAGKALRRSAANPRKDTLLRSIYDGERGLPFTPL